jgi:hypothetical protein
MPASRIPDASTGYFVFVGSPQGQDIIPRAKPKDHLGLCHACPSNFNQFSYPGSLTLHGYHGQVNLQRYMGIYALIGCNISLGICFINP